MLTNTPCSQSAPTTSAYLRKMLHFVCVQCVNITRCLHREVVALERLEGGGQGRAGEESGDVASAQEQRKHNACDKDGCKPEIRVRLGQRRLKVGDEDMVRTMLRG